MLESVENPEGEKSHYRERREARNNAMQKGIVFSACSKEPSSSASSPPSSPPSSPSSSSSEEEHVTKSDLDRELQELLFKPVEGGEGGRHFNIDDLLHDRKLIPSVCDQKDDHGMENLGAPAEGGMPQKHQHMLIAAKRTLDSRNELHDQQKLFKRLKGVLSAWMLHTVASDARTGVELQNRENLLWRQINTLQSIGLSFGAFPSVGRKIQDGSVTFMNNLMEVVRTEFFQDNPLYINWLRNKRLNPLVPAPGQDEITSTLVDFIVALGQQVAAINRGQLPLNTCAGIQSMAALNQCLQENLMLCEKWDLVRHSPDPNIKEMSEKYTRSPLLDKLARHPNEWNGYFCTSMLSLAIMQAANVLQSIPGAFDSLDERILNVIKCAENQAVPLLPSCNMEYAGGEDKRKVYIQQMQVIPDVLRVDEHNPIKSTRKTWKATNGSLHEMITAAPALRGYPAVFSIQCGLVWDGLDQLLRHGFLSSEDVDFVESNRGSDHIISCLLEHQQRRLITLLGVLFVALLGPDSITGGVTKDVLSTVTGPDGNPLFVLFLAFIPASLEHPLTLTHRFCLALSKGLPVELGVVEHLGVMNDI